MLVNVGEEWRYCWLNGRCARFSTGIEGALVGPTIRLIDWQKDAIKIAGNQRYSRVKNQRSWFVSRTRPCR
jgi:hypothetical protein